MLLAATIAIPNLSPVFSALSTKVAMARLSIHGNQSEVGLLPLYPVARSHVFWLCKLFALISERFWYSKSGHLTD